MKVWKKNLIAAAILVTVCAGIYVNWRYTEDQAAANLTDTLDTEKVMSDDNLVLSEDMAAISAGEDVATTSTDYFAAVRLSRQQARDNAVNLLQEAMSYSESSKEAESAVELEQIVQTALSEAQIESLIIAKGYADCVAYMSGEGISIAVASPEGGLQREDVATTSTDYFAAVRLSRQQARDNAVNLLQEAMSYSESSKEAESAVELEQIVQTALNEAQIESLVIAKGYADCVAYMSGEGISIAVASPEGGLQREDVAVIADIVMAQSDYSLNDIRVVEVQ